MSVNLLNAKNGLLKKLLCLSTYFSMRYLGKTFFFHFVITFFAVLSKKRDENERAILDKAKKQLTKRKKKQDARKENLSGSRKSHNLTSWFLGIFKIYICQKKKKLKLLFVRRSRFSRFRILYGGKK